MKIITYFDLGKNLAYVLVSVIEVHSPVLVTRQNKKTVILISLNDFNCYEETAHLLKSPANAKR
ncbi:type II toxin-antitoxin system Phd/YefM family antitoxin [Acinetobacter sp. IRS14]|uniref:type II toxin-antitoxin system Phd/YefM family antitoxin n=1 Tax=Acinetobacter sp. IRS14 TaxID=2983398 RepID=UPI002AFF6F2B|nr:type II toxin-antitoxin system Phd/YefM family antitoxin [Acinetobacter sp. IRS14]MEA1227974.1 type II toxin-antitoxin system Phd/YefM family antitoxin [Acinetobacter sp. IRS14]